MKASTRAGQLAFDILRNEFHLPIVDGKANRENIEDQIQRQGGEVGRVLHTFHVLGGCNIVNRHRFKYFKSERSVCGNGNVGESFNLPVNHSPDNCVADKGMEK